MATRISVLLTFPLACQTRGPKVQAGGKHVAVMLRPAGGRGLTVVPFQEPLSQPEAQAVCPLCLALLQSMGLSSLPLLAL